MAPVDRINVVGDNRIRYCSAVVNGTTYGMSSSPLYDLFFSKYMVPTYSVSASDLKYNREKIDLYMLIKCTCSCFPRFCRLPPWGPEKWGLSSHGLPGSFDRRFKLFCGGFSPETDNCENPSGEAKSNRSMAFPISRWDGGIRSR